MSIVGGNYKLHTAKKKKACFITQVKDVPIISLVILVIILVGCIFADYVKNHDPTSFSLTKDASIRKTLYGEFEAVFAKEPASVLIAYLDGNYVGVSGLKGLDTKRVLGHHAVGVMWNIENWTLAKK